MFKKLAKQLKSEYMSKSFSPMTSPIKDDVKSPFLTKMSKDAVNLYERKIDINNFKKLVLSNPENESHNKIVDDLFLNTNTKNPFSEEALFELSENTRFLEDLGLK
jgi:hypothetical protein